jgi:hypothetical protein
VCVRSTGRVKRHATPRHAMKVYRGMEVKLFVVFFSPSKINAATTPRFRTYLELLPHSYRMTRLTPLLHKRHRILTFETYCLTAKLLLALASTAVLRCLPHGTHDHILFSDGSGNPQTSHTNSVRTSRETHYVSATKTNQLMLFREAVTL